MKTTVKKVLAAHAALACMKITGDTPYRTLRELHRLRDALGEETSMACESQEELIWRHGGNTNSAGQIHFLREEETVAFKAAWEEVLETEIALDVEAVDLSAQADHIYFNNADADLEVLSDFIIFEKGETDG